MSEKLLEIKDLSIRYTTDKIISRAVNHINLSLNKGEVLGLVGETGAGKTTTALSMLGLLPKYTSEIEGSIEFEGEQLVGMKEKKFRDIRGRKISMIFQDPMTSLNPVYKVGEQIGDVIRLHNKKMNTIEVEKRVGELLNMVGIDAGRKNEYPHQFSGGMKQRVVIAIALACNPALLLADEPTTALDVTIQAQVLEMMRGLKEEFGTSMILITHDLGVVAEMCNKVAIMYAGEIIEYGTARHIFKEVAHPYTIGLFGSLPSIDKKEKRLHPINGLMPDPTDLPKGCKFSPRCPYATDACKAAEPELKEISEGHFVRCFRTSEGVIGNGR